MERKVFGKYIVADPKICHGELTFAGTRIIVKQVLDMVAEGMAWDEIVAEWGGKVPREAIREAIELANRALIDHADEYAQGPVSRVNVLDENVAERQRDLLRQWRIAVRHIAHDLGQSGMSDEDIIPLLRKLRRPTLFTQDRGFYRPALRHGRYCLVWLNVRPTEAAEYVRRVLGHPELNTQAKRMGTVIEAAPSGLTVWRLRNQEPVHLPWPSRRRK